MPNLGLGVWMSIGFQLTSHLSTRWDQKPGISGVRTPVSRVSSPHLSIVLGHLSGL